MGGGRAGEQAAEVVDGDGLEPERQLADARPLIRRAVVAPASRAPDAMGAGRDWPGRAVHGCLLGGVDVTGRSVAPAGTGAATAAV